VVKEEMAAFLADSRQYCEDVVSWARATTQGIGYPHREVPTVLPTAFQQDVLRAVAIPGRGEAPPRAFEAPVLGMDKPLEAFDDHDTRLCVDHALDHKPDRGQPALWQRYAEALPPSPSKHDPTAATAVLDRLQEGWRTFAESCYSDVVQMGLDPFLDEGTLQGLKDLSSPALVRDAGVSAGQSRLEWAYGGRAEVPGSVRAAVTGELMASLASYQALAHLTDVAVLADLVRRCGVTVAKETDSVSLLAAVLASRGAERLSVVDPSGRRIEIAATKEQVQDLLKQLQDKGLVPRSQDQRMEI
jgi:hypothetical protein